jgi:hypothetical protein
MANKLEFVENCSGGFGVQGHIAVVRDQAGSCPLAGIGGKGENSSDVIVTTFQIWTPSN